MASARCESGIPRRISLVRRPEPDQQDTFASVSRDVKGLGANRPELIKEGQRVGILQALLVSPWGLLKSQPDPVYENMALQQQLPALSRIDTD